MNRKNRSKYARLSFTREQLVHMGLIGPNRDKDLPTTSVHETFPAVDKVPYKSTESYAANKIEVDWFRNFTKTMKDSTFNVRIKEDLIPRGNMRYSEICALETMKKQLKERHTSNFYWPDFPYEIWPPHLKKYNPKNEEKPVKPEKSLDKLTEEFAKLEKDELEASDEEAMETKDSDSEKEDVDMQEDADWDEENDYGANYFDNGEAYNDEDDNLDDGPVY